MATKETGEFIFTPTDEPNEFWVFSKASGRTHRADTKDLVCTCEGF